MTPKSLTCALTHGSRGEEVCSDWMALDCFAS
jgi:hypothetical protein